jgi:hypothetical protein
MTKAITKHDGLKRRLAEEKRLNDIALLTTRNN